MSSSYSIFVLDPLNPKFPHFSYTHPGGIIAIGGKVDAHTLLDAYAQGIFPWYNDDLPLWWNPDPRFVLFPPELKVSKSMRPYFNQQKYSVSFNLRFEEVIQRCRETPRIGQSGTWLNDQLINSFCQLHEMGYAHSAEVWNRKGHLVGGLYGMAIGKVFFGESMFSQESNASKYGFITFVKRLQQLGIKVIDCQQETAHLRSLGARPIPRENFMALLHRHANDTGQKLILS